MNEPKVGKIGKIEQSVINTLGLSFSKDTPIFIGHSNIAHMKTKHFDDYSKYGGYIADIIKNPTFVGINPKDGSI